MSTSNGIKISQLVGSTALLGPEELVIVQNAITKNTTMDDIATFIGLGPSGITSLNGDLTAAQIIAAGTGLNLLDATNTHTFSIDNTVVTLTDTQILLNKTLTDASNLIVSATDTGKFFKVDLSFLTGDGLTAFRIFGTTNQTMTFEAGSYTILGDTTTATLTNKTFDANGTGNSLSNVDVADLADGTPGELISWGAANAPNVIAAGTEGQILVAHGAALPTFEANAASSLTDGLIFVGDVTNQAVGVAMSGDATIDNTGILSLISTVVKTDQINTYTAGLKQSFVADATTAGININTAVPSTPAIGDIWRSATTIQYRDTTAATRTLVDLSLTQTLSNKTLTSPSITSGLFFDDSDTSIIQSTIDLFYDVAVTGTHILRVADISEYSFTATEADWNGNNLVNFGYLESVTVNPATSGVIRLGNNEFIGWLNFAGDTNIILRVDTTDTLVTSGSAFGSSGGDLIFRRNGVDIFTMVTSGISMGGQNISLIGELAFADANTGLSQSALNLLYDVATGGEHQLRINDVIEYAFSATQADFNNNSLVNAPHNHENAAGGTTLIATNALTATGTKDATTFLRGDDTWSTPADLFGITTLNSDTTAIQTLTGTTNRITIVDSPPDHAFDIASTYVGQSSITTLGTITTGIWNGTAITGAFINAASTDLTDTAVIVRTDQINSYDAGLKQTFVGDIAALGTPGLNIAELSADPPVVVNGDVWYDNTFERYRGMQNDITIDMVLPINSTAYYVKSQAELEAKMPSLTIPDDTSATIVITESMVLTAPILLGNNTNLNIRADSASIQLTYVGTGALFQDLDPGTSAFRVIKIFNLILASAGTQSLFDITGDPTGVCVLEQSAIVNYASWGTLTTTNFSIISMLSQLNRGGLTFIDCPGYNFFNISILNNALVPQTYFSFISKTIPCVGAMDNVSITTTVPEDSLVFYDPNSVTGSEYVITNCIIPSTSDFFQEGTDIAITGVINNVGLAEFTTVGAHSLTVGDEVNLSGFVTETTYNQTKAIVTLVGSTVAFETGIAYSADDTGILEDRPITITAVANNGSGFNHYICSAPHGLITGQSVVISDFVTQTAYNGTAIVTATDTDLTGVTFDTDTTFGGTDIGLMDRSSLDSTNLPVISKGNPRQPNSMTTGDAGLELATEITIDIVTQDVPVPITDAGWDFNNLERTSADTGTPNQGRLVVDELGTRRYSITYSATIQRTGGGGVNVGIVLLKNGDIASFNPPRVFTVAVTPLTRTEIIEVTQGDILQVAVINYAGDIDINVYQANMTLLLPEG